ncbi:aromatic ring-hydroxylating dioxygenase subunit alpha [Paenibacillus sp. MAH-36]|uniref:Aromatic ring-hydroxylating dioxygenase subunit alpha n=1 Tax=Paenibacillus violae TaxID=3077234 RepID=A0ABU3RDN8_9BACL|nr:aromatic ring-hydroxylating dioxygenase subunit alpha [Paenibacillus sp. PFR10]MDU0202186.1 aromatic ring-hydroxylating dioxygenase subunit alpha [Paenibacillus sp. PFR10]
MDDKKMYHEVNKNHEKVFPTTWYAVAWSKELEKSPIKRTLLGKDLVLYRNLAGKVSAVHAYCPHRGADLSLGTCRDGQLVCPYHAWRFDTDGRCIEIPAHPNRPIPAFAHTFTYPVTERAGLLWVYPKANDKCNADAIPELQIFPELEDPQYIAAPYGAIWRAHLTRVIESVIDVAHVPIVHRLTIGKKLKEEIQITFEADGDHIHVKNGNGLLHYQFPQNWILTIPKQTRNKIYNYVTFTPIDENMTAIFGLAGRNFGKSVLGMNTIFSRYSAKVLEEDRIIVESQHPRPIPEALRMEAHVPADGPQVRFRQRWYDFLTGDEQKIRLNDRIRSDS